MQRFAYRWHRRLIWLALAALCLAVGGPLLSQSQRLLAVEHVARTPHVHADAGHHGTHAGAQASHHDGLAACDYCFFFLHMPGLPAHPPALAVASPAGFAHVARPVRPAVSARYPRYIVRGPPLPAGVFASA